MSIGLVFEPTTRLASLKAAETYYMSVTPFTFIKDLRADPRMRLWGVILPGIANIITMNTKLAPLDDIRVRQALLYAFDRKSYVDITTEGLRPAHDSVLSPATWGYDPKAGGMYPHDSARATSLLDDAGWKMGSDGIRTKDGQPLHIVYNGPQKMPGEVIQAQFKPLGVDVEVVIEETGTWLANMHAGKYHTSTMAWGYLDPSVLRNTYHSSNIGKPTFQWSQYSNPAVDKMLDDGETELDDTKRLAIYAQVQEQVMKDAVAIPTSASTAVTTFNQEFLGGDMWQDGSQMEWLYDTYVKK
jgi:peptide/nickel transport system substrate-binding protein